MRQLEIAVGLRQAHKLFTILLTGKHVESAIVFHSKIWTAFDQRIKTENEIENHKNKMTTGT